MTERKQDDMALWTKYKGGDQGALVPLLTNYEGVINRWVGQHATPHLPNAVLRQEAITHIKKAIDSYNPTKGAALNTHVHWALKKGTRLINRHANVGRLPDQRALMVGRFRAAKDELSERLGRPPSAQEIADHFKADFTLSSQRQNDFSIKQISRLETELRSERTPSDDRGDFGVDEHDAREDLAIRLVYDSLTPRDQSIFEHLTGFGGKPVLKANRIAKMFDVSATTIGKKKRKFGEMLQGVLPT